VLKVMLLSKLKTAWVVVLALVVGAGAVGLTYGPAAAQPGRGDETAASRATADDLEELRLEVAALRQGLEATRQRVKALEGEVRNLKAGGAAAAGGKGPGTPNNALAETAKTEFENYTRALLNARIADNPLAEAQSALKKLRANPQDKEAADALNRALERLQEREQKRRAPPGNNGPGANPAKP
jgi:hypothetical protein